MQVNYLFIDWPFDESVHRHLLFEDLRVYRDLHGHRLKVHLFDELRANVTQQRSIMLPCSRTNAYTLHGRQEPAAAAPYVAWADSWLTGKAGERW